MAIVLIFMQWGFLGAVAATAVRIYDRLEFDILLRSPDYFHFCDAREIPRESLFQVASMPEVQWTRPLHVTLATWRIPATPHTVRKRTAGELRGILAVAMEPALNVFTLPEIHTQAHRLTRGRTVLIDRKSKGDDYGAMNDVAFGSEDVGREVEIGDTRFEIAGHFSLGTGLAANGSVLMSSADFARIYPGDALSRVQFGLVKLKPGVQVEQFCVRARQHLSGLTSADADPERLDSPVTVLTRADARRLEIRHWLWGTPIGAIFMIGVAVALVVGSVVVYMVLSNDVANHVREFATLMAMGYDWRGSTSAGRTREQPARGLPNPAARTHTSSGERWDNRMGAQVLAGADTS